MIFLNAASYTKVIADKYNYFLLKRLKANSKQRKFRLHI